MNTACFSPSCVITEIRGELRNPCAIRTLIMELGVLTLHGRVLHPQRQGKEERFNRSLKKECLEQHTFRNLSDAADIFAKYREFYNNVRPHMALGLDVPASKYKPSQRSIRHISENGNIRTT